MSPASFRFDHRDFPVSLQAILASLEEHYPQEISIIDWCEVTCHTKRTEVILGALTEDAPRLEIERTAAPAPDQAQAVHVAIQPACAECSQPFTPKTKSGKFCEACKRKVYNRRYRETHSGNGNGKDNPDKHLGETRLLDIHTGEVLEHQVVLAGVREGKYPEGRRFRRSKNRMYEVVTQERNGNPRLSLKQVYDPLPIA